MLRVNEIFGSIQGESTHAGLRCAFVRLTGCNLRCRWCDTAYAFHEGRAMTVAEVVAEVARLGCPIVEVTGGEPLLQEDAIPLLRNLLSLGGRVLLETGGSLPIETVPQGVARIVDVKCPASGEAERNRWENLQHLKSTDEIKFVIATREDYEWAKARIGEHELAAICPLLFSWAHPLAPEQQDKSLKKMPPGQTPISRQGLAEKILADALPVRFQVQLHKVIWAPEQRGV